MKGEVVDSRLCQQFLGLRNIDRAVEADPPEPVELLERVRVRENQVREPWRLRAVNLESSEREFGSDSFDKQLAIVGLELNELAPQA